MIYDGLLSRSKLRTRLADHSQELSVPSQVRTGIVHNRTFVRNELTMATIHSHYRILLIRAPLRENELPGWIEGTAPFLSSL